MRKKTFDYVFLPIKSNIVYTRLFVHEGNCRNSGIASTRCPAEAYLTFGFAATQTAIDTAIGRVCFIILLPD